MRQLGVFILFFLASSIIPKDSFAQTAISIGIDPPVLQIDTSPPSSVEAPIIIQNFGDAEIDLSIKFIPFKESEDKNGQIQFLEDDEIDELTASIISKVQILRDNIKINSFTLDPLSSERLIMNINLDKNDPRGDYYFSVVFITSQKEQDDISASQIPAGISSNILLSIGPKGQTSGIIKEFSTKDFVFNGPIDFNVLVNNTSEHVVEASGKITITNLLGQKSGEINLLPQYILANSSRFLIDEFQGSDSNEIYKFKSEHPSAIWPETFLLGFYTADLDIFLEEGGIPINAKTYFFVFPVFLLFGLAIVIFIILGIFFKVKKRI